MKMKNNKDLKARTKEFALNIIAFIQNMPKDKTSSTIGNQLLRAGTSVGANTRASFRARSRKEYIAKVGIVIEEADECMFWLEIIKESRIMDDQETISTLLQEAEELTAIFVSIRQKYRGTNEVKEPTTSYFKSRISNL